MEESRISIIYKNFDELIKENRGLFKFFRKSKNPGLIKAVWFSRENEVQMLKEKLSLAESSNHSRLSWKTSLDSLTTKFNELTRKFEVLKFEHKGLQKQSNNYKNEFLRYRKYSKSLEVALKATNGEKVDEENQKDSLSSQLIMTNKALLETDKENSELHQKIMELQNDIYELQDELNIERSKSKQHLRINNKMENELFRLNNELEQQQFVN